MGDLSMYAWKRVSERDREREKFDACVMQNFAILSLMDEHFMDKKKGKSTENLLFDNIHA